MPTRSTSCKFYLILGRDSPGRVFLPTLGSSSKEEHTPAAAARLDEGRGGVCCIGVCKKKQILCQKWHSPCQAMPSLRLHFRVLRVQLALGEPALRQMLLQLQQAQLLTLFCRPRAWMLWHQLLVGSQGILLAAVTDGMHFCDVRICGFRNAFLTAILEGL